MAYFGLNDRNSTRQVVAPDGHTQIKSNRYAAGELRGSYRTIAVVHADASFDSMDSDNQLHVLSLHNKQGGYINTVAVSNAFDDHHAIAIASRQFDSMQAASFTVVAREADQFDGMSKQGATWPVHAVDNITNNISQNKDFLPVITAVELEKESARVSATDIQWDGMSLSSHNGSDNLLYRDLIRFDRDNEMLSTFDSIEALREMGDVEVVESSFDSLMTPKGQLPRLRQRLYQALSKVQLDNVFIQNVTETEMFKRQGVTNIAFICHMSDGQTISIWFHNPDSTPNNILPDDIMISWKWMLNKRDVTAVLSPKHGDNVSLPLLAGRMMRLVVKNSKRYTSAQVRKAKHQKELLEAQALLESKETKIETLDKEIIDLNTKIDAAMLANKGESGSNQADGNTKVAAVDKSYKYAIASTEFKESVHESISLDDYSPFLSSKNIDSEFKKAGVDVSWSIGLDENGWTAYQGQIMKGKDVIGRVDMGADGKAMIFIGASGDDRARKGSYYSEDLNSQKAMVEGLLKAAQDKGEALKNDNAGDLSDNAPDDNSNGDIKEHNGIRYQTLDDGLLKIYMNGKNDDHWSIMPDADGSYTVVADNAQTRAYNSFNPKVFDNKQDMFAKYKKFKPIFDLLGEADMTNQSEAIPEAIKPTQDESEQPQSAYSQDDVDYLNNIIDGSIDADSVDMDKVIEIGEKDEADTLFIQALDVITNAVDEQSANV